uniref:Uncharacterized protein n=1 Tax=Loxodonta africana TaxID=9785 RepID=G3ULV5_LOXAF
MPHLLTQTKAILQSHIDSKCWQTLQGTVIAHIFISQGCGMPGSTEGPQFPCKPENKLLELHTATDPDISLKVRSSQTLPGAVIENTKLSRSLPKGAMEKLGANLQDKHLAFLSGLPALYYLAPSKATGPPITSQSAIAEIMPEPVAITRDSLTEMVSYEERCISPGPGHQDDETHADGAQEFLTKVQEERTKETVRPEIQRDAAILKALKTSILTKLNFHLRKKVLEMHLGIPIKVRESWNQPVAVLEKLPTREVLGNLNNQGKTSLQELPIQIHSAQAPEQQLICLRKQLIVELKAVQQRKNQASSTGGPHGSAHQVSKISQLSEDTADAQELCAQVEARVKKECPWQPRPQGDSKERNAGFGLPSTIENRHPAEDQKPAGLSVNRTPGGPWQRSQSFDIAASCQQSPKYCPQFKLPKVPPGAAGGKDSEKNDMEDSETNINVITE